MTDRSLLSTAVFSLIMVMAASPALAQAPPLEWETALGSTSNDYGKDIEQTTDGGYIVAGAVGVNDGDVLGGWGSGDAWVVKLDGAGGMVWQTVLGGTAYDCSNAVVQTTDGGYLVAGSARSNDGDVSGNHGGTDFWVVKLDAAGAIQWQRALGGSSDDEALGLHQTSDGGYVVVGWTNSNDGDITSSHGGGDAWLVKLDAAGTLEWQKTFGGSQWDDARAIRQCSDGGYIVAGNTASANGDVVGNHNSEDGWVMRLDAAGNLQWQIALGGAWIDALLSVELTTDSGCVVVGFTYSNDGDIVGWHSGTDDEGGPTPDGWVVKLSSAGVIDWQKPLGGTSGDLLWDIRRTADGGCIVAGQTASNDGDLSGTPGVGNFWIVRLDNTGAIQWQKLLGGSAGDAARCLDLTSDGGYVAAGSSYSVDGDVSDNQGGSDIWIVKLASDGVGLAEQAGTGLSLAPNPATNEIRLTMQAAQSNARIALVDPWGREVLRSTMSGSFSLLDVGALPRGLYVISIQGRTGRCSERVILE